MLLDVQQHETHLESHNKLGFFLASQEDLTKLTITQRLAYVKIVERPATFGLGGERSGFGD